MHHLEEAISYELPKSFWNLLHFKKIGMLVAEKQLECYDFFPAFSTPSDFDVWGGGRVFELLFWR